jgi:Domain of unknown function (DUF5916)/Carbohydrate family 9 binding domain-like
MSNRLQEPQSGAPTCLLANNKPTCLQTTCQFFSAFNVFCYYQNTFSSILSRFKETYDNQIPRMNRMPVLSIYLFTIFSFLPFFVFAQDSLSAQQKFQLHIKKVSGSIKIDGDLSDDAWKGAEITTAFSKKFPNDDGPPKQQTEVKTTYDENYVYFAFTSYSKARPVIQSLKRDIGHDSNDGVAIILDPVNQRTNGFFFVLNALNVQSDDLLTANSGNGDGLNFSWDNKWLSATKIDTDKWTAEIAIPFKTLRYTPDKMIWGINFLRIDIQSNEYSTWAKVPRNFRSYDLGYTGTLVWDAPPPHPGSNIAIIPYVTGGISQDKEANEPTKLAGNAGFDAKIAVSSALNLDLTVNPDFSQIEVDKQVTNLTRYNIFFPEHRTFFLENADLFAEYGIPPIRPFYSRTIGLDNNGNKIPILFGARLSGNLAKRTRIGIMNIQTGKKKEYAAQNYSAVSINQSVLKRSVLKGYFLNRQGFLSDEEKKKDPLQQYGRNAGVAFDYSNLKGTWGGWSYFNHSYKPGIKKDNNYIDAGISYTGRAFNAVAEVAEVGTNYYTDMGFVERIENYDAARDTSIRLGFKHLFTELGYKIFPKHGAVGFHSIQLHRYYVLNPNNSFNEVNYELEYNMMFNNSSFLFVAGSANTVQLLYPISFTDKTPLPVNRYQYNAGSIGYMSDIRKTFSYTIQAGGGSFYNGSRRQLKGSITLRSQPHLNVTLQAEYDKLQFPEPYGNTELFLIAPRIEFNFSTNLFWTTFLQYNTQRNNFNINSRLQWRYKPMSDLFLVYTDNYFTDPFFKNKSRAFVFKINYWLNI